MDDGVAFDEFFLHGVGHGKGGDEECGDERAREEDEPLESFAFALDLFVFLDLDEVSAQEQEDVGPISRETIRRLLKKTASSHGAR